MSLDQNKKFVENFLTDIYNHGNLTLADEVIASPILRGAFKRGVQMPRNTFSDFHISIEELIAEGDQVVARCCLHGIFERTFLGLRMVKRTIQVDIIGIFRLADHQIKGIWYLRDEFAFIRQLGPLGTILFFLRIGRRSQAQKGS